MATTEPRLMLSHVFSQYVGSILQFFAPIVYPSSFEIRLILRHNLGWSMVITLLWIFAVFGQLWGKYTEGLLILPLEWEPMSWWVKVFWLLVINIDAFRHHIIHPLLNYSLNPKTRHVIIHWILYALPNEIRRRTILMVIPAAAQWIQLSAEPERARMTLEDMTRLTESEAVQDNLEAQ